MRHDHLQRAADGRIVRWYLIAPGALLIALAAWETIVTVLTTGSGGGPLTDRVGRGLWRLGLGLHRPDSRGKMLQVWGVGIVALTPILWMSLLVAGWTLVLAGASGAIVHSDSGAPAGTFDRFYFAGYTAFTLGNGEFRPDGSAWQAATVLLNVSGLLLVTLAVTYLVPVVEAATQRRRVARTVATLGGTPQGIVSWSWEEGRLAGLGPFAEELVGEIQLVAERHLTYPVLHYYRATHPEAALLPRVSALHDALVIVLGGLPSDLVDSRATLRTLQRTIRRFAETFPGGGEAWRAEAPPAPSVEGLVEDGVPVDPEAVRLAADEEGDCRAQMAALVAYDGWEWSSAVLNGGSSEGKAP